MSYFKKLLCGAVLLFISFTTLSCSFFLYSGKTGSLTVQVGSSARAAGSTGVAGTTQVADTWYEIIIEQSGNILHQVEIPDNQSSRMVSFEEIPTGETLIQVRYLENGQLSAEGTSTVQIVGGQETPVAIVMKRVQPDSPGVIENENEVGQPDENEIDQPVETFDGTAATFARLFLQKDNTYVNSLTSEVTVGIGSYADMKTVREVVNKLDTTQNIKLELNADIDLQNREDFVPMCTEKPFSGTFDGNGHTLTVDISIRNNGSNYAPLFVYLGEGSTVKNVSVKGSVTSDPSDNTPFYGAIAIYAEGATVDRCWNDCSVTLGGTSSIGGIVAQSNNSEISECLNTGTLKGTIVGGICSEVSNESYLFECVNSGALTGTSSTGQISAKGSDEENSYYFCFYTSGELYAGCSETDAENLGCSMFDTTQVPDAVSAFITYTSGSGLTLKFN